MSSEIQFMPHIFELQASDGPAVMTLLGAASEHYLRYAPRFREEMATLVRHLQNHSEDRWWGFRQHGELIGFFMLRGFDEGYAQPFFGVFISESASARGLARWALSHSLEWCRDNRVPRVMLKVHLEHHRARGVYESAGFRGVGVCPESGQQIMEKSFLEEAADAH